MEQEIPMTSDHRKRHHEKCKKSSILSFDLACLRCRLLVQLDPDTFERIHRLPRGFLGRLPYKAMRANQEELWDKLKKIKLYTD